MASLLNISRALTKHSVVNTLKVARNNKIKTTRYFSVASALQHYNHRSSSVLAPGDIKKMYDNSMNDPNSFWGTHGRDYLHWIKDFQQVSNSDMANGKHEWFLGGKLNVSGMANYHITVWFILLCIIVYNNSTYYPVTLVTFAHLVDQLHLL